MHLNRAALDKLWPKASPALKDGVIAGQADAFALAQINTPLRLAHFLAQISHESNGGSVLEENLNYSAKRMTEVWPSRFPTIAAAQPFAHNPKALAIRTYGGRLGNRPAPSTDGHDFRGRGYIQLTGRDNYAKIGALCGLDLINHPDLANAPASALKVACGFWLRANCNPGADEDSIEIVTRKINGGLIGLSDRRAWLSKWKHQLS